MTEKPHHIAEIFEQFPPDWQMRKRFRPDTFGQILQADNKPLVETYHAWMKGDPIKTNLKARISTKTEGPLNWRIEEHSGGLPGGIEDWKGMALGAFEDNWERHFTCSAFDYWEARDESVITCHQITQRIECVERSYHRLILPQGDHVLVASSLLYLRQTPETAEEPRGRSYNA